GMSAEEALPQPAVAEDSLDHIRLATFDKTDDLHRAATFGTFQWIDFVDSLDQPRPDHQLSSWPLFRPSFYRPSKVWLLQESGVESDYQQDPLTSLESLQFACCRKSTAVSGRRNF
ncbi:MAG: hypothetical protein P8J91_17695, partial [Pirellulaceae bacterium]|nr:hypothetical protein [Pirellulaceae bacterium]